MAWLSEWWNQVSATVAQGLSITALGMALVFFTLGLVIVAMILLTKLPWLRSQEPAQEPQATEPAEATPSPAGSAPSLPEPPVRTERAPSPAPAVELSQVAAIAVAILRSRGGARARVPQSAGARSAWKSYGRAHQLGL